MSTVLRTIVPFFALAAVVTGGLAVSPTAAIARSYYHPYTFHHYSGVHSYAYRRGFAGSTYARVPIYNPHDAHRLSRQTVGVGD